MGASIYNFKAEGGAALALSGSIPAGGNYRLLSVTLHLSAAPVTAGALTITLDAAGGGNYDTLLKSVSLVGVTDYLWLPDQDLILTAGDAVDVAYANPDARTYGTRVTLRAV